MVVCNYVHAHGGIGGGEVDVGVICSSKIVGRRLQNDIGQAILKNFSWGVAIILIKLGLRDTAKKGCFKVI